MTAVNPVMESGFATISGARLYFEKKGSGPAVVLVHGYGLDCRMWEDQFSFLSQHFQVIRYDARGFGRSSLPEAEPYAHHEDLSQLLQFLGIASATVVGHSMGGRIVTDFALSFPEKTNSLVLVDAALNGYSFSGFSMLESHKLAKEKGIPEANEAWQHHELFDAANRIPAVANRLAEMTRDYSGWHWTHKNPWTPLDPPSLQQLPKIEMPTLVLVGDLDLPDFRNISGILLEKIPGAKRSELPGVGHMCNMEDPGSFNHVLLEFLQQQRR